MVIEVTCKNCGHKGKIFLTDIGEAWKVKCPECGTKFTWDKQT